MPGQARLLRLGSVCTAWHSWEMPGPACRWSEAWDPAQAPPLPQGGQELLLRGGVVLSSTWVPEAGREGALSSCHSHAGARHLGA